MWGMTYSLLLCFEELCSVDFDGQVEMFVLTISQPILILAQLQRVFNKNSLLLHSSAGMSVLSVRVEYFFRVSNKIMVTIFTMSGGGGALGLGEALENRVGPLVKGGELKGLEGADGQTGQRKKEEEKDGKKRVN